MDAGQYEVKFKKLLEKFLEPNFQIQNDVYLNTLLTHLSGEQGDILLSLPLFTEWITQCCSHWEKNKPPSQMVATFTLHLLSLLSKDEKRFAYFKTYNVYNTLCSILKVKAQDSPPSIKLAYIKMLSSFLHHKSGIDWLISTDSWRDTMNYCLESQTVYIIREGHQFMLNLLQESIDCNEIFCNLVIKQIILKLTDMPCQNGITFPEINEETLKKQMTPVLRMITYIFEQKIEDDRRDYRIPFIFINNYHLEACIWKLSAGAQHTDFIFDIDKVLIAISIVKILAVRTDDFIQHQEVRDFGNSGLKLIGTRINKLQLTNVLKFCHYSDYLWRFVMPRLQPPTTEQTMLRVENQLFPLEITPMLSVMMRHCKLMMIDLETDDVRDNFVSKIFKSMSEQTTRLAFQWKEVLSKQDDIIGLAQQAMSYIMSSRKFCTRSRAVITFQTCIYAFQDLTNGFKNNTVNGSVFIQNPNFLISMINLLSTFINEYNITWRESVETICVLSVTLDFLNLNIWPPRVVVEALKLLNLSIAKYMSPQLALLVDDGKDSTLDMIPPLLTTKLHDINWEVRDTALEILNTISTIACTKFPSFQKLLLDSNLIILVVTISVSDSESFVRSSAIKCLQEMIKVSAFWNSNLMQQELPLKMMHMLLHETEAIVRTEAACLMRCIYEHQAFPEEIMDEVYRTMAYAATSDLHWEVKTNALDFWGKVMLNHLQNQGMIDGRFPNVTFSKEHRKIVTLTENEIRSRLSKVLRQLSRCGCLGVLISAMQDDCDLEVTKKAVLKAKKIRSLFEIHNFKSVTPSSPSSPAVANACSPNFQRSMPLYTNLNTPPVTPKVDYSDDVIDQIINSSDINLLTNVYNPNENASITKGDFNNIRNVTPEVFLNFLQTDLDSIVDEKTRWLGNIDDLNSLLDDMLKSYDEDINSMDCY